MKKIWKNVSTYVLVALVSIGATYGMYSFMDNQRGYSSADFYNYGNEFDQKGVQLASLTADGYPDFTKAAENSVHAVVHIKSTVKSQASQRQGRQRMIDPFEYFFGFGDRDGQDYGSPQPSVGFGSGVIISKDGYIITSRSHSSTTFGTYDTSSNGRCKIEWISNCQYPFSNFQIVRVTERNIRKIFSFYF